MKSTRVCCAYGHSTDESFWHSMLQRLFADKDDTRTLGHLSAVREGCTEILLIVLKRVVNACLSRPVLLLSDQAAECRLVRSCNCEKVPHNERTTLE